jgi:5'-3' exonuclease
MDHIDWMIVDMNNLMFRTLGAISKKAVDKEMKFSLETLKVELDRNDYVFKKWTNSFASAFFSYILSVQPKEGVLCAFDIRKTSWRYQVYDGYKGNRGDDDSRFAMDLDVFFERSEKFLSDLISISNRFKVFRESGIEADDVTGVVTKYWRHNKKFHGISNDQDWLQCYRHGNYVQSKNGKDKFVVVDPITFLQEKIYLGDSSDTIPNIYRGLGAKTLITHRESGLFYENLKKPEVQKALDRNRILIDFENIPKHIDMLATSDGGCNGMKLIEFMMTYELNEAYQYKKDELLHYFRRLKENKWN